MSTPAFDPFYTLHSESCTIVLDCRADLPSIGYWGPRLSDITTPEELGLLATREEAPAREHKEAPLALTPMSASGFLGRPGLLMHRNGVQWNAYSPITSVDTRTANTLVITSQCKGTEIELIHRLFLDPVSNVLKATTELINRHKEPLVVDQCNAPCLPVPDACDQILGFTGRWSGEFRLQSQPQMQGSYVRENRSGRTSHDSFPAVIVHDSSTSETHGTVYGFHLGWSGNHRVAVDKLADGRSCAQLGELFYPGELILEQNESYTSPPVFATCAQGLNEMSQHFHRYVRSHLTAPSMKGKSKLVHFNSWEAVYFDLNEEKLFKLVEAAAEIGAERFVLDDGWFRHRRSDNAGLGDWYVEEKIFPQGLHPLAKCINDHGLEFGLWFEPEMVNPDSDLYRAHPDWALQANPAPAVLARHQLVLDLTRPEVQDYLFERLDSLLTEYPITYIKWDMNRDLHQPGNALGQGVVHAQTHALYALLKRLREAHPCVEIESCSSGGGRADFGILEFTDRVWTSDSNDALDRISTQHGFSLFFPSEFMGAHVGPAHCHITGRHLSMALRGAVAMFGDMGVEANLLEMEEAEKTELKAAIELHKKHRGLIFSGNRVGIHCPEHEHAFGIVSADQKEALFSYTLLTSQPHALPGRLRLQGLDQNRHYTLNVVWPAKPRVSDDCVVQKISGARFSGAALMYAGIQLPLMFPESPLVIHVHSA